MLDQDNRYVIVFNGEIYNFSQLRNEITQSGGTFKTSTAIQRLF